MQWSDDAILVASRKFGENSLIIDLLTENHGLHSGMIRSGRKQAADLQTGNILHVNWRGRLSEHLGTFQAEIRKNTFSCLISERLKLSALASACSLVKSSLPEREPHPEIFSSLINFINTVSSEDTGWIQNYIEFEFEILGRLGFGIDTSSCAASGETSSLIYVSPKSGQAVSEASGEPYKQRLLKLPSFMRPQYDATYNKNTHDMREIIDGAKLTLYFLDKYVFGPKNKEAPKERGSFMRKLEENSI